MSPGSKVELQKQTGNGSQQRNVSNTVEIVNKIEAEFEDLGRIVGLIRISSATDAANLLEDIWLHFSIGAVLWCAITSDFCVNADENIIAYLSMSSEGNVVCCKPVYEQFVVYIMILLMFTLYAAAVTERVHRFVYNASFLQNSILMTSLLPVFHL
ncbi:uncharacterized protein LOC134183890 isoform X3 [Corticium candelabrum]|uniref:uncharacterized protein LOC134183890 isoform X3 n=1 Tax=Corticium candelabrum TaxID=121492 RepID=UPI002E32FD88|nr:uncharacterized protein LOC134183890 isoform X3 [Corticium candelabrum]